MSEATGKTLGDTGRAALAHGLRFATQPLDLKAMLQMQPQNLAALHLALGVLGDSRCTGIAFEIPRVKVDSQTFAKVRDALVFGRIPVYLMGPGDPDLAVSDGVYMAGGNILKIAPNRAQPLVQKAKIVHEAVHAAHDLDLRSELFVRETEMAAYIAEAMFIRHHFPKALSMPLEMRPTRFAQPDAAAERAAQQAEAISAAAWALAVRASGTATPTAFPAGDADLAALEAAVTGSDLYAGTQGDRIQADGVP